MPTDHAATLFGRVLTVIVTPFRADGSPFRDAAVKPASWLVDRGNDGLVRSETTGEAPTTTDAEKADLVRAAVQADSWTANQVLRATDPAWYWGDDGANLLHLMQGGTGFIGVTSHVASPQQARMIAAVDAGDLAPAHQIHRYLEPAVNAVMHLTEAP